MKSFSRRALDETFRPCETAKRARARADYHYDVAAFFAAGELESEGKMEIPNKGRSVKQGETAAIGPSPSARLERAIIGAMRPLHFRGKYRLLNPIVPNFGIRAAWVFGLRFRLDLADWIQRSIYIGTFEWHETRLVANLLTTGMTVIDVGANIGYYTALAASRIGFQGRIFSVEPDPRAFMQLQNLIAENHLAARAFNFGLGAEAGKEHLYQSPNSRNNTPTMVCHGGLTPSATVPIKRLDDCIEEWGLERVDLLKIDVEGWEPQVFRGASQALSSGRIKAILCEFNDSWLRAVGSSSRALWGMLADFGYRPYRRFDIDSLLGSEVVNCLLIQ